MGREVWLVDAFTTKRFGGNVAGVVPFANELTDEQMQAVAAELAASETAFVLPPSPGVDADLRLRYFTPAVEVDLCGHATIGSMAALFENGRVGDGLAETAVCRVETRVGVLPITLGYKDGLPYAEMGQAAPRFREAQVDLTQLASWLGISADDFDLTLPLGISSTGLWDLFVPVKSLSVMQALRPDFARLAAWNMELDVASTHLYTKDTVHASSDYHARDFSPALGIPEDPATGTASGALSALLRSHGHIGYGQHVTFEQGFEIHRDSYIEAHVEQGPDGEADSVFVGGPAVVSVKGELMMD
jgi:trans-2,3-dihydro-3-hydroxyanthranilate isomerase